MPEEEKTETVPMQTMPALALRGLTVYPKMMVHFDVGREASVKAIEESMSSNQPIFLVAQKDIRVEEPDRNHLFAMGTVSVVRQILRLPGKTIRVMVEGQTRARLHELTQTDPYLVAQVEPVETSEHYEGKTNSLRAEAAIRQAYELFDRYSELSPKNASAEMLMNIMSSEDAGYIADFLAQNVSMRVLDKQSILDELRPVQRLNKMNRLLRREVEILEMEQSIQRRVQENMTQNQKDAFLREQVRVIQEELGEEYTGSDADSFLEQLEKLNADKETKEKIRKEIMRFKAMPGGSQEANVLRTYIETVLELPWKKTSRDNQDIRHAEKILEEDHYGLEKVKERVLEYLAVRVLTKKGTSPILCLVGPPGTGKTSIARSVARALNKKYVRISLGGVHDEAEIRGHRKTYVGSMPGRIAEAMRQAGVANPLMLLDEIDKVSGDYKGDVASALLEVLDGEQNVKFRDHYVEIPLDLSGVLFIATANTTQTIPGPLLDRMEVIEVSSYTENEKMHIAKEHLLGKQVGKNGLEPEQLTITDEAMHQIISGYTREAGVRNLERKIGEICRKAAREIYEGICESAFVDEKQLEQYLGKERFHVDRINEQDEIGIVRGLAWTSVGGDTLQIEVNVMPGKGEFKLTGQLGDVMKESAQAGISYIRSVGASYDIPEDFFTKHDIHIHIPEGAVPKDGPSAGITMATAMLSAITKKPVRADVAMTGEITLRGRVLPIGGLKEKLLAAKTAGIRTVCVPAQNEADIAEISEEIREGLQICYVKKMEEVLKIAMNGGTNDH